VREFARRLSTCWDASRTTIRMSSFLSDLEAEELAHDELADYDPHYEVRVVSVSGATSELVGQYADRQIAGVVAERVAKETPIGDDVSVVPIFEGEPYPPLASWPGCSADHLEAEQP
jgi:hypothetical protein